MRPRTKLNYNFPLNEFIRAFKPGKHHATITYWGKDHGSKKNRKVPVPSKITSLSELKLVSLNLPKEGMHGFGITQECWLYVFGETGAHPNCNPLGLDKKLTAYRPTRVQGLGDCKIVQVPNYRIPCCLCFHWKYSIMHRSNKLIFWNPK